MFDKELISGQLCPQRGASGGRVCSLTPSRIELRVSDTRLLTYLLLLLYLLNKVYQYFLSFEIEIYCDWCVREEGQTEQCELSE